MNYTFFDNFEKVFANHPASFMVANVAAAVTVFALVVAILIDFVYYHKTKKAKKKQRSLVETGTMFLFFFVYYVLLNIRTGRVLVENQTIVSILNICGAVLVVIGGIVNILGRMTLKGNWANQVTIYEGQTLVTTGAYRLARHPLYASIIWMLLGGCLIYLNYIALASVVLVFIPMMIYRARQEEKFLMLEFPEYADYRKRVGMFSPKLICKL